jgi:5-methylcytosine-specific restriction endonuclease McrA
VFPRPLPICYNEPMSPRLAPHPCSLPGCKALATKARCSQHDAKRMYYAEHPRGPSPYSTGRWQRERRLFLAANPYCVVCGGPANTVDHVTPVSSGVIDFWDTGNWAAMCAADHSAKTAKEDGRWTKRQR